MLASCNILIIKFDNVWFGCVFCVVMNGCHGSGSVNNKTYNLWLSKSKTQQWLCHLKCFLIFKNSWTSWDFEREKERNLLWIVICATILNCSYVAFNLSQTSFEICNVLANWIC
jgi:hypothetical protein